MTEIKEPYLSLYELIEHGIAFIGVDNIPAFLVSDSFYYATADAESFELERAPEFYELYKKHGYDGILAYVSLQRQIDPLKELMTTEFEIIRDQLKYSNITVTISKDYSNFVKNSLT